MINFFKKILNGQILPFIFLKYSTNIISFIKITIIVSALGNYYYGIWGFILLLRQYLTYGNLGTHFSLNILLSKTDNTDKNKRREIISNSFTITFITALIILVISIIIKLIDFNIFPKYNINTVIIPLGIIVSLNYINLLFINIYRVYSKLYKIALYQMVMELSLIPLALIFTGQILLNILLYTIITVQGLGILFFSYSAPFKIELGFNKSKIFEIIRKGFSQLLYNASSVYLILSSITIISIYFTIEQLGYYTFANSLSNAVFIGISAIGFVFFPKFINVLQESKGVDIVKNNLLKIRKTYLPLFNLMMLTIISLSGVVNYFLKSYNQYHPILVMLLLSRLVYGYIIGYDSIIISRNREKQLIIYGVISIGTNILLNIFSIRLFNINTTQVAFLLIFTTYIYIVLSVIYGNKLLNKRFEFNDLLRIVPINILIIIIVAIIITMTNINSIYLILLPIIYFCINFNYIINSITKAFNVLINKKSFEI